MAIYVPTIGTMAWEVLSLQSGSELNFEIAQALGYRALSPGEALLIRGDRNPKVVAKLSQVPQSR
jgi:hypothetical protein